MDHVMKNSNASENVSHSLHSVYWKNALY